MRKIGKRAIHDQHVIILNQSRRISQPFPIAALFGRPFRALRVRCADRREVDYGQLPGVIHLDVFITQRMNLADSAIPKQANSNFFHFVTLLLKTSQVSKTCEVYPIVLTPDEPDKQIPGKRGGDGKRNADFHKFAETDGIALPLQQADSNDICRRADRRAIAAETCADQ